jgi:sugar phosphate isomerase/epimerase
LTGVVTELSRRHLIKATVLAGAALACAPAIIAEPKPRSAKKCIKLGIASYSYWHFRDPKVSIETVMDKAAEIGVEGVDILHRQMDIPEKAPLTAEHRLHLHKLKRHAFRNGLEICCLSTHQSFVKPKPEDLTENAEHTKKCVEIAYELGCPCIRINTGRWGTTGDFDELMKNRGVEPVLPGYTEDDGFKWCIEGIERCLLKAEECGVMLALENHWGLARTPEGLLRILTSIKSPWLSGLMDTGNFLEDPYSKLEAIAPSTVYVQAKTYYGGGEWYTLELDYRRIARILRTAGYAGYVSLEFEGKQNPDVAVPNSIKLLREAFY